MKKNFIKNLMSSYSRVVLVALLFLVTKAGLGQTVITSPNTVAASTITAGNTVTINAGGTLNMDVSKSFASILTANAGTSSIVGAGTLTTGAINLGSANGSNSNTLSIAAATTVICTSIANTNGGNANKIINLSGILRNSGTTSLNGFICSATSTVEYNGAVAQTIFDVPSPGYGNLIITNSSIKTAAAGLDIQRDLTINSGTFSGGSFTHTIQGNWINNGTFTPGTSTINFNAATGNQTITKTGGETFSGLTISKATSGNVVPANNVTVTGTLTFTRGLITTSTNSITATTVTGAASNTGWVNGNLVRNIAANSTVAFAVGDATNYTPASLVFTGVTAGTIQVTAQKPLSSQTAVGSLSLDQGTNALSRYWSVIKPGGSSFAGTYTGTFTYISADLTGVNSALRTAVYNGTAWSYPGAATFGTLQVTSPAGITPTATSDVVFAGARIVTVSGATVTPKIYNGNTSATLDFSGASIATVINGNAVTINTGGSTGTYNNKNVGSGKAVTAAILLTGADAAAYLISPQPSLTGNITARPLTITGAANSKIYNGTTISATNPGITSGAVQSGDVAAFTQVYDTKNAGTLKGMIPSGVVTDGNSGNNYSYTFVNSNNGTITARALTITGAANSKPYDGNTNSATLPTLTSGAVQVGDVANFIQNYNNATAGTGKTMIPSGTVTDGNSGNNYSYTFVNSANGTITGVSVVNADFRSKSSGNFSSFGISGTWEYDLGGGSWTDATQAPLATNNITISNGHTIDLDGNFVVGANKTLLMNATSALIVNPSRTLAVAATGTINFNGQSVTFKSDGTGTASLGQVAGSLTGATNVTVERYIRDNGFRSWRLLSVPTTGSQTIKAAWQEGNAPLANNTPNFGTQITGTGSLATAQAAGFDNTAASPAMLRYNGSAWVGVPGTGGAISAEKAYFLYIRGERTKGVTGMVTNSSATTLRTNGTLFTGNQATAIPTSNSFGVVGNVYPSAINFTSLSRTGGVSARFYIYDSKKQQGNNVGVYQTFSATNSYECQVDGGSYVLGQPNTAIESGQAFFVQTDATPGGGTITLTEGSKIGTTSGNLGFRPLTPASELIKIDSRLYQGNGDMADANTVVFDNGYSNAVNGDDALKMTNPGENFGIQRDNSVLAIEGRQPAAINDVIPFKLWNLQQQQYQFEFVPSNLGNSGLTAELEDSYLNSSTPVSLDAAARISFSVDANPASAAAERFRLVFRPSAPLPVSFTSISANRTAAGVKANWTVSAERNIRSYEVERSTDGRTFISAGSVTASGNNAAAVNYSFTDAAAPATTLFYRVKSIGTAGEVKYSTVVKVLSGNIKPGFAVSPNPVEGGIVNLQFTNQAEGRYTVRLLGTGGQSIFSSVAIHAGGNSTQVLNIPANIARGTYQLEIIAPDKTRTTKTLLVENK